MLLRYFGFHEDPFGATPDPRFLYNSRTHQEAFASLMYSYYSNRGFSALIAPPGLGKTTLLFRFLADIQTSARTVFLFDALCEPLELVACMLRDLGITPGRNGVEMREQLKEVLVNEARAGRRFVVVIDEAQNMSEDTLEMVRLLTNFETPRAKLVQIVLAGQPKLADKLMRPSLEQLRQRISTFCRLEPLSAEQIAAYIDHRLKLAGYVGPQLFTEQALELLSDASHGVPRTINHLCFNSLTLCCALKGKQVDGAMAAEVIADQQLTPSSLEILPVIPEIISEQKVEFNEPERAARIVKPWAIAAAALLLVSGLSVLAYPTAAPYLSQARAQAMSLFDRVPRSIQAVAATTETGDAGAAQRNSTPTSFQVVVGANQRLSDIAVQYLGSFNPERLRQIQALNPKLTDPDHIEEGQTLWIPGSAPTSDQVSKLEHASGPLVPSAAATVAPEESSKLQSFVVTVEPNQTVRNISMKYLGGFDLGRLHQIKALNPNMTDPDHILLGQKIRLPVTRSLQAATISTPPATLDTRQ